MPPSEENTELPQIRESAPRCDIESPTFSPPTHKSKVVSAVIPAKPLPANALNTNTEGNSINVDGGNEAKNRKITRKKSKEIKDINQIRLYFESESNFEMATFKESQDTIGNSSGEVEDEMCEA